MKSAYPNISNSSSLEAYQKIELVYDPLKLWIVEYLIMPIEYMKRSLLLPGQDTCQYLIVQLSPSMLQRIWSHLCAIAYEKMAQYYKTACSDCRPKLTINMCWACNINIWKIQLVVLNHEIFWDVVTAT